MLFFCLSCFCLMFHEDKQCRVERKRQQSKSSELLRAPPKAAQTPQQLPKSGNLTASGRVSVCLSYLLMPDDAEEATETPDWSHVKRRRQRRGMHVRDFTLKNSKNKSNKTRSFRTAGSVNRSQERTCMSGKKKYLPFWSYQN